MTGMAARQIDSWARWSSQYEKIRGRPYDRLRPRHAPTYLGILPQSALARMVRAAIHPSSGEQPLGADFNKELWRLSLPARSPDPILAVLLGLPEHECKQCHFN